MTQIDVCDVVYLKAKSPLTQYDNMTVARLAGDTVDCVWIDVSQSLRDGTFALHQLARCGMPRPRALLASQVNVGSTVQLPSAGLNNGMIVDRVDGNGVRCSWVSVNGQRRHGIVALNLLELLP